MKSPSQLDLFEAADPVDRDAARQPSSEGTARAQTTVATSEPAALRSYGRCELSTLRARLALLLGTETLGQLTLTDNRSRILSSKRNRRGEVDVRIHRCFTTADDETLEAAAAFISGCAGGETRKRLLSVLRRHFAARPGAENGPGKRRLVLRQNGAVYDLGKLCDTLEREYFTAPLDVRITWGRAPKRRKRPRGRFSIRLGSYSESDRVIRIHPALDRPFVPRYVVESVIYHELLHAALPAQTCNGRRRLHPPEFRRLERRYTFFSRAEKWLEANLERLVLGY